MTPTDVIQKIACTSASIAWQAGVGGMETAGSIVSYLAKHPEQIDDFLAGRTSIMDWPVEWHEQGGLSWHGQDGKIHTPEEARRHRTIKKMERGA